jgi:hypothetical protein
MIGNGAALIPHPIKITTGSGRLACHTASPMAATLMRALKGPHGLARFIANATVPLAPPLPHA